MRIWFALVLLLVLLVGAILLQIYLSKRESKWPGLILPALCFLYGLLYPLNMTAPDKGISVSFVLQMIAVWLLGNIPTIVLLAIYFVCREKGRRGRQLDKMNIHDLR